MKAWTAVVAVAVVAAGAGCVDISSNLKVKPDGSGTLAIEQYFSPQMTGMLEGMAEAPGEAKEGAAKSGELGIFEQMIDQEVGGLGEGVKIVSKSARTNAAGWKGYRLVCSFDDVTKLRLSSATNVEGPGSDEGEKPPLRIEFTPGSPAKLVLREPKGAAAEKPKTEEAGEMDPEAMMQMMAPMMAGMRMGMTIEVVGKIGRTNARFVEGNKVIIADVAMDKIMANPEAGKLLMGAQNDPEVMKKISAMKIDGVRIQTDPVIEIEFE